MNFVQEVERLRQEVGAGGQPITTVVGHDGLVLNLINWVRSAWVDIQTAHEHWTFLKFSSVHSVPANATIQYTNEAQSGLLREYVRDSFRIAKAAEPFSKSRSIVYCPWQQFQWQYLPTTTQYGPPSVVSARDGDNTLYLGPAPNEAMQLWFDYYRTAQQLTADTDIPIIPPEYHDVIWQEAALSYGRHMAAAEIISELGRKRDALMGRLERRFLPIYATGTWG